MQRSARRTTGTRAPISRLGRCPRLSGFRTTAFGAPNKPRQRSSSPSSLLEGGPALGSSPWRRDEARPTKGLSVKQQPERKVAASAQPSEAFSLSDVDGYIEANRHHLRTVYDWDRWVRHRSPSRYLRHLLALPGSRMLRGMAPPLLYVLGIATLVCLYQGAFQAGLLPTLLPDLHRFNSRELGQLFGLTSFALSLLLVFRTNASYERWDSARKMWGLVLNRSRDIVRQGLAWIPSERAWLQDMLCRWVPAFSKALMCHLRKGEDLAKELEGILLPHEVEGVLQAKHRPNYILQVLAQIVRAANLPTALTLAMEQNLTNFEDCLGGCERILRTPIPLSYSTHTSRFIISWLTVLPFTLFAGLGWGTVPACGVIAFLLLGIKEITVTIEEPFGVLALEAISNTALANTRELHAMHAVAHSTVRNGNGAPGVSAAMMVAMSAPRGSHGSVGNGLGLPPSLLNGLVRK